MTIWVDADACVRMSLKRNFVPRRRADAVTAYSVVANQALRVPPSRFIRTRSAWPPEFDVAFNEIVRQCERAIW